MDRILPFCRRKEPRLACAMVFTWKIGFMQQSWWWLPEGCEPSGHAARGCSGTCKRTYESHNKKFNRRKDGLFCSWWFSFFFCPVGTRFAPNKKKEDRARKAEEGKKKKKKKFSPQLLIIVHPSPTNLNMRPILVIVHEEEQKSASFPTSLQSEMGLSASVTSCEHKSRARRGGTAGRQPRGSGSNGTCDIKRSEQEGESTHITMKNDRGEGNRERDEGEWKEGKSRKGDEKAFSFLFYFVPFQHRVNCLVVKVPLTWEGF